MLTTGTDSPWIWIEAYGKNDEIQRYHGDVDSAKILEKGAYSAAYDTPSGRSIILLSHNVLGRPGHGTTSLIPPFVLRDDGLIVVAINYIFSLIWRCYGPKRDILDYWGTILYCLLFYYISYWRIKVYRAETMDMGKSHWNNSVIGTFLIYISTTVPIIQDKILL